jgi:hypothetical protein
MISVILIYRSMSVPRGSLLPGMSPAGVKSYSEEFQVSIASEQQKNDPETVTSGAAISMTQAGRRSNGITRPAPLDRKGLFPLVSHLHSATAA